MHEYIASHHDRKTVYYVLAVLSGIIGSGTSAVLAKAASWGIVLAAPSGVGLFLLVFLAFDHICWKWSFLYKHGLIKIPNLNGLWTGSITSSALGVENIPVSVMVHQTYSRIRVRLETDKSISLSHMATISMEDPACFNFRWEYLAEFRPYQGAEPKRHFGVTHMILKTQDREFHDVQHGSYYTELARETHGRINLQKSMGAA